MWKLDSRDSCSYSTLKGRKRDFHFSRSCFFSRRRRWWRGVVHARLFWTGTATHTHTTLVSTVTHAAAPWWILIIGRGGERNSRTRLGVRQKKETACKFFFFFFRDIYILRSPIAFSFWRKQQHSYNILCVILILLLSTTISTILYLFPLVRRVCWSAEDTRHDNIKIDPTLLSSPLTAMLVPLGDHFDWSDSGLTRQGFQINLVELPFPWLNCLSSIGAHHIKDKVFFYFVRLHTQHILIGPMKPIS